MNNLYIALLLLILFNLEKSTDVNDEHSLKDSYKPYVPILVRFGKLTDDRAVFL